MIRARTLLVTFAVLGLAAACSEATDGLVPSADVTGGDASAEPSPGDAAPAEDAGPKPTYEAGTSSSSVVLLNEVSASGEWVELVNAGTSAVDVSGWMVADRDKDTGGPRVAEAAHFEPGTILSPRAYALVKGGGADAGKPCPEGGQSYCALADFGISAKNGETIFLLLPDAGVVGTLVVPPATNAPKGESFSRVPSGTPDAGFAARAESPGAKNPD